MVFVDKSRLKLNYFLLGMFVTLCCAFFIDQSVLFFTAVGLLIYFIVVVSLHFKGRQTDKTHKLTITKTKEHKELAKINKRKLIEADRKHEIINNQVAYIQEVWELTLEQQKTFVSFIEKKAYSDLYSKMSASLLPQLIKMIDTCIAQNRVGCKRDVSRRINELVAIMKEEIKRKKSKKREDFETLSQVYDHLIDELK